MTEPLSPAAQAVLDAYLKAPCDNRLSVAAALRAAADQIKPHISRTPWLENGYFNETFENYEALGQLIAHSCLLVIAAELEAQ